MNIIDGAHLSFSYQESGKRALKDVDFTAQRGELIAVLGRNGSGKSTLAKHINALVPVSEGTLTVAGLDAALRKNVWKIRKECGMVFQNPDNQFVSSVVEEDIAFGLENYDFPENEIDERIKETLEAVGMSGFEKRAPQMLSGGQKQRLAIAGVLAINPDIMLFDEVTSMLDPEGRQEVLDTIKSLHKNEGKTIIMITHYIEEAVLADKIVLMNNGSVLATGSPRDILTNKELLDEAGLSVPLCVRLYCDLKENGTELPYCPINNEELAELLCRLN